MMASTPCYYGDAESIDGEIYIIKWTVPKLMDVKETDLFCPNPTETLSERQLQLSIEIKEHTYGQKEFSIKLKSQTAVFLKSVEVQVYDTTLLFGFLSIIVKDRVFLQSGSWNLLGNMRMKSLGRAGLNQTIDTNLLLFDPLEFQFKFVFPYSCLNIDLENLFLDGLHSDTVMKSADGEEFRVHKGILANRCAVLKANFELNTIEATTNIVESPFESAVLKQVLLFIYTDRAEVNENTEELLAAAEYYQLSRLKSISEDCLEGKLTVDNAIETLQLADLHNADKLKQKTLEFIKRNKLIKKITKLKVGKISSLFR